MSAVLNHRWLRRLRSNRLETSRTEALGQPAYPDAVPVLDPQVELVVLDEAVWRARAAAHEARVDALVGDHLARRGAGVKHPVHDFLFTYYSFRPAQLRRWSPGFGVVCLTTRDDASSGTQPAPPVGGDH